MMFNSQIIPQNVRQLNATLIDKLPPVRVCVCVCVRFAITLSLSKFLLIISVRIKCVQQCIKIRGKRETNWHDFTSEQQ